MMSSTEIYLWALLLIMGMMTLIWITGVFHKDASIVDPFWGFGFVVVGIFYFLMTDFSSIRQNLVVLLVFIWGLRLSGYLLWRNWGKEEDYRYQSFRENYGEKRYWWISYFQVFLLQGLLKWLVSAPLPGAMQGSGTVQLNLIDYLAVVLWVIGFAFEANGDFQLARFKSNPANKGKVLDKGFWKFTRHPNYFGDAAVWWSFALFSMGAGAYWSVLGSLLMMVLIIKVSGVALLERNLKDQKPHYQAYIKRTSAFIPWFPKKND